MIDVFSVNQDPMFVNQPSNNPFIVDLNKKKATRGKVKKMLAGMAEIAYSLGETNDPEEFAHMLSEDIVEALDKYKKKKGKKRGSL